MCRATVKRFLAAAALPGFEHAEGAGQSARERRRAAGSRGAPCRTITVGPRCRGSAPESALPP